MRPRTPSDSAIDNSIIVTACRTPLDRDERAHHETTVKALHCTTPANGDLRAPRITSRHSGKECKSISNPSSPNAPYHLGTVLGGPAKQTLRTHQLGQAGEEATESPPASPSHSLSETFGDLSGITHRACTLEPFNQTFSNYPHRNQAWRPQIRRKLRLRLAAVLQASICCHHMVSTSKTRATDEYGQPL